MSCTRWARGRSQNWYECPNEWGCWRGSMNVATQAIAPHTKIAYLRWPYGFNSGAMLDASSVVVVDDHACVRSAISNLLRSSGIRVLVYASAEELLSAGDMPQIACIIIDVEL